MSLIKRKTLKKAISTVTAITTVVWLSGVSMFALTPAIALAAVEDGNLIKSDATNPDGTPTLESLDVYIVKLVGTKKFKRLVLNPTVFESYGHLNWEDIQTVSQSVMDEYTTSGLVRVDGDPDEKVYAMTPDGDIGSKSWINLSAEDFLGATGSDADSIYTINSTDGGNYNAVGDITTTTELEAYYSDGTLPEGTSEGSGLTVALSASTPAAGYILVDGTNNTYQLQAPLVKYNMTAEEDTVVESITFKRSGFIADADIDEMYLFVDGEMVDYGPSNTESKMFVFSTPFTIEAGDTAEVEVMVDIDSDDTDGDTVSIGIDSADDITTDGAEVEGSFPINGNTMNIADVDLATVDVTVENENVTNLEIGTKDEQLAEITIDVNINDVVAEKLAFTVVGSLSANDLANFELVDDSDDSVVASVESMTDSKMVVFDDLDLDLEEDNYTFYIKGDIMGGAGRDFKFTGDEVFDFSFVDQEQEVKVPANPDSYQILQDIEAGDFTVELADDSPLGNVADGEDEVVLARYDFTAGGERIKVESLGFQNVDVNTNDVTLENVKLLVDGSQKGSTITTLVDDTDSGFDFGNTFTINLGETAVVEIVADLTHANVTDADEFHIANDGGAGTYVDIQYELLDSNSTDSTTLPDGYSLVPTTVTLDVALSAETPVAQMVAMSDTKEIGRWELEADNGNVDIRDVEFTNSLNDADFLGNINSATLKLYKDDSEIESVTRSVKDSDVWFGNDGDVDGYDGVDNLDWELEAGDIYELALEYTFRAHASGASGAVSGTENTATLNTVTYYDGTSETTDDPVAETAETVELRRSIASLEASDENQDRTLNGSQEEEIMSMTISEESGAYRTYANSIRIDVTSDRTITGTEKLVLRRGNTSGTIVAKLENTAPTNGAYEIDTDEAGDGGDEPGNLLQFTGVHGLSIGDVILVETGNDGDVDDPVVVVRLGKSDGTDADTYALVKKLDGTVPTVYDNTAIVGDVVFLNEATLVVPFLSETLGRISDGSSQTFVMVGNTVSGDWTEDDKLTVKVNATDDLEWWDGSLDGDADTDLEWVDDFFTSTYLEGALIESELEY